MDFFLRYTADYRKSIKILLAVREDRINENRFLSFSFFLSLEWPVDDYTV